MLCSCWESVCECTPNPIVLCVVDDAAPNPVFFSGNQLLNDSRARLQVVTSETLASDSLSIEIEFASGQVSVWGVWALTMQV